MLFLFVYETVGTNMVQCDTTTIGYIPDMVASKKHIASIRISITIPIASIGLT